jgi:serine/threonine protein kinase/Flp pilus assembly protein TadD
MLMPESGLTVMNCPNCQSENPPDTLYCGKCGSKLPRTAAVEFSPTDTLEVPLQELAVGGIFEERYRIIEELGKGGMGRVYKAIDTEIGEKVALKLLKPEIASDEATIERFRNEIRLARQISHKNVCRTYHLSRGRGSYYITMEYVSGEDLKSTILRVGQLSVGKTVAIIRQVCDGLAEAHRLGIVHRDLKPQNIMIDREGSAKIMDFGIARSLKTKGVTEAGIIIGTPEYMAPEQVDAGDVDRRADIYALGIILYEMLTGRVPFEGDTPFSVAYKQKTEAPPDPRKINPQIPDELAGLILKCLAKDREARCQSAEEVQADLLKVEKAMPTTERSVAPKKPTTSRQVTVTFGLKKLLVPAVAVVAVAVIAAAIWLLLPQKAQAKQSIAVVSFKNQTGDKSYDYLQDAIPNLLITSLEQSKYLSVMTWERMRDLLKQSGRQDVDFITSDLGFELCEKDGVRAVVLGSFVKAGDVFATDVKVLDVNTKKLLKSASSQGEGVRSILEKQIGVLSKEISKGVGLPERNIEPSQGMIANLTTSSMEAYEYYLKGRDAYDKFYYEESRKNLQKAVELDPGFAIAYLSLSEVMRFLGNSQESQGALEKAKSLAAKATEKERLYIDASYASAVERDTVKRLKILQELVGKYPKEKQAHYLLGVYDYAREQYDRALGELGLALKLDPEYGAALNQIAYTYGAKGDYESAVAEFKSYGSLFPNDANPLDSIGEMYFRMGRLDEAVARYDEALRIRPSFENSIWAESYIYALKQDYDKTFGLLERFMEVAPSVGLKGKGAYATAYFHFRLGQRERCAAEIRRLIEIAKAVGHAEGQAATEQLAGWLYLDEGKLDLSREANQRWFDWAMASGAAKELWTVIYALSNGHADLKENRLDRAKQRLNEINSVLPAIDPSDHRILAYWVAMYHGEILLKEGAAEKAEALLETAAGLGVPPNIQNILGIYNLPFPDDVLARAYAAQGAADKAVAEYEHLTSFDPKRPERFLIHPGNYLRLAKLYEKSGEKDKAAAAYRKFLGLWKNADAGLPEPAEARRRLAALGS